MFTTWGFDVGKNMFSVIFNFFFLTADFYKSKFIFYRCEFISRIGSI